jgi:hypothetical protein
MGFFSCRFIRFSSLATIFSRTDRSSQPQAISQNQGRTPLISPSGSYRSGLEITSDNSPSINTAVPIGETLNRVRKIRK